MKIPGFYYYYRDIAWGSLAKAQAREGYFMDAKESAFRIEKYNCEEILCYIAVEMRKKGLNEESDKLFELVEHQVQA